MELFELYAANLSMKAMHGYVVEEHHTNKEKDTVIFEGDYDSFVEFVQTKYGNRKVLTFQYLKGLNEWEIIIAE